VVRTGQIRLVTGKCVKISKHDGTVGTVPWNVISNQFEIAKVWYHRMTSVEQALWIIIIRVCDCGVTTDFVSVI
jgi:hypothetical protein